MISNDLRAFLLFIEPTQPPSSVPFIDALTRKMAAAFRAAKPLSSIQYCGFHDCSCGALSDTKDFVLPDGRLTNSLCVHYLAYHRAEVPTTHLQEVLQLNSGELQPTELELRRSPNS